MKNQSQKYLLILVVVIACLGVAGAVYGWHQHALNQAYWRGFSQAGPADSGAAATGITTSPDIATVATEVPVPSADPALTAQTQARLDQLLADDRQPSRTLSCRYKRCAYFQDDLYYIGYIHVYRLPADKAYLLKDRLDNPPLGSDGRPITQVDIDAADKGRDLHYAKSHEVSGDQVTFFINDKSETLSIDQVEKYLTAYRDNELLQAFRDREITLTDPEWAQIEADSEIVFTWELEENWEENGGWLNSLEAYGDSLYIGTMPDGYKYGGRLFRYRPGMGEPVSLLQASIGGSPNFLPSRVHPDDEVFLSFGTGDSCGAWGSLYHYSLATNQVDNMFTWSSGCVFDGEEIYGQTNDDRWITGLVADTHGDNDQTVLSGVASSNRPVTVKSHQFKQGQTNTMTLLDEAQMPRVHWTPVMDEQREVLYLSGENIWQLDLNTRELRPIADLRAVLPLDQPDTEVWGDWTIADNDQLCFHYTISSEADDQDEGYHDLQVDTRTGQIQKDTAMCQTLAENEED